MSERPQKSVQYISELAQVTGLDPKEFEEAQAVVGIMSKYLPNDQEALMRYSIGLTEVGIQLLKTELYTPMGVIYTSLGIQAMRQAEEGGFDVSGHTYDNPNVYYQIGDVEAHPDRLLSVGEAVSASATARNKGAKVGLLHGHFRLLTLSSVAYVINAYEHVDHLFVGIEAANRTERDKEKENIFTDKERAKLFRRLLYFPFLIDDQVDYSDEGYRSLVSDIKPNVYFGQSHSSDAYKDEQQARANVAGSEYVIIENLPSLSTSDILEIQEQSRQ